MTAPGFADPTPTTGTADIPAYPSRVPARPVRVLFINDTARNGGPGRSLHSILKFLDPRVTHRAVVLPRDGAIVIPGTEAVRVKSVFPPPGSTMVPRGSMKHQQTTAATCVT